MKTYKIRFIKDYTQFQEWAKEGKYWKDRVENNPEQLELCKKWKDKEITILELEELIEELEKITINKIGAADVCVVFNGNTIMVYNDLYSERRSDQLVIHM